MQFAEDAFSDRRRRSAIVNNEARDGDFAPHRHAYRVRTEDELEEALAEARDREALVLIELVMSRLDAPGPLLDFAQRCAEFNFPRLTTVPSPVS
jgi:hypothetical protein